MTAFRKRRVLSEADVVYEVCTDSANLYRLERWLLQKSIVAEQ
jgi:hypothetical protein